MRADGPARASSAASRCARRSATRPRPARSTTSTGSSRRRGRTRCGSRTSPTSRPGPASSTSPSSSTPTPGASSAGGCRGPAHAGFVLDALEQALHERRPVQGGGLVHHSDRGVAVRLDHVHRAARRGRHRAVGRQRRRQLRQRARRDDQRPLQGRGDPPARAVAHPRGRRVRHARMGRPSPACLGGLTLTAMDRLAWLAPQGVSSRCDPHSDRPPCLSPDLSAAREHLAARLSPRRRM